MDVTVCVATFGDQQWADLAEARAIPSAQAEGAPVSHAHADTLHDARNLAVEHADTEWVVHLDADDELEPGYLAALMAGTADIRAPAVRYVRPRRMDRPAIMPRVAGHHHDCDADCLPAGNWLVVGSLVRRSLVLEVGGWRNFPVYEDWDLWLRCWLAGASFEAIPAAVYRAWVRPDSRNRAPCRGIKESAHQAIDAANLGRAA